MLKGGRRIDVRQRADDPLHVRACSDPRSWRYVASASTRLGLGNMRVPENTLAYGLTQMPITSERERRCHSQRCAHILWYAGLSNAGHLGCGGKPMECPAAACDPPRLRDGP